MPSRRERAALVDDVVAQLGAYRVDRLFDPGPAGAVRIRQIGRIGLGIVGQIACANADQAEMAPIGFAFEGLTGGP